MYEYTFFYLEFYVSDLAHSTLLVHGDLVFGFQMHTESQVKFNQLLLLGDLKDLTHSTQVELHHTT